MLINTIGGGNQQAKAQAALKDNEKKFWKTMGETSDIYAKRSDPRTTQRFDWNFEPPPYPETAHKNLQRLQEGHQQQRQQFGQNLKQQVADMKQEFFSKNHYATKPGADGKLQVALNDQGQPMVEPGPEKAHHKEAREGFESKKRNDLNERQTAQKDTFLRDEKANIQQFMQANAADLNNPAIQAQLQQLIVTTQKKAFQLQQNHEDERWKDDLPPDSEMVATVEGGLSQMRAMEEQQARVEENSQEMKDMMEHEQTIAAMLSEQKELAKSQREDETFLQDPRKMMASAGQASNDFSQVLPGYLTNALYNMEIYEIEQPQAQRVV